MAENLLNVSSVLLFGRVVTDVQIVADPNALPHSGANKFLPNQIGAANRHLARIYSFAFEGTYYELSRASLFLVHGDGAAIGDPVTVERIGSAATGHTFADDIRVWTYDKSDISLRLDAETGSLEKILLDMEVSSEKLRTTFAGQHARLRPSRTD